MAKRGKIARARGFKRGWDLVCQGRCWKNSSSIVTGEKAKTGVTVAGI